MKRWTKNNQSALPPKASVVVAVYNKPREFEMCLEGYARQSLLRDGKETFQLIIADDGSQPEIEQIASKFAEKVTLPVTYLYKNHQGWGKLKMLNWSILESLADQIIFTDGDCVPHKHFVREHAAYFKEKRVCCGRRVDLMEKITPQLNLEHLKNGTLESPYWILRHAWKGEVDYAEQGLYLPRWLLEIEEMFPLQKPTLLGSNFSIHKKWLREVNGFDESFQSPGLGEDTDMERRLKPLGLEFKWIKHRAIQYHLWHPLTALGEQSRSMYAQRLLEGNRQAIQGLKELKMELRGHPTY